MSTELNHLEQGPEKAAQRATPWHRFRRSRSAMISLVVLTIILLVSLGTLHISSKEYQVQQLDFNRHAPQTNSENFAPFGYDVLGRNLLWRCMFGGVISLGIGVAAAAISVVIGTAWGAISGWYGGRVDNVMMRLVDILYGLPYILLVILLKIAFEPKHC